MIGFRCITREYYRTRWYNMTWDYRIVHSFCIAGGDPIDTFSMREAYYNEDGDVMCITVDACGAMGETADECEDDYKIMAEAFKKPVLEEYDIKEVTEAERDEFIKGMG